MLNLSHTVISGNDKESIPSSSRTVYVTFCISIKGHMDSLEYFIHRCNIQIVIPYLECLLVISLVAYLRTFSTIKIIKELNRVLTSPYASCKFEFKRLNPL